jgi:hypothetical protein
MGRGAGETPGRLGHRLHVSGAPTTLPRPVVTGPSTACGRSGPTIQQWMLPSLWGSTFRA